MSKNISTIQEKTILNIIESKNVTEAIKKSRISRATFYKWLSEDKEFRDGLIKKQQIFLDQSFMYLKLLNEDAFKILHETMQKSKNEALKIKTAMFLIDRLLKHYEIEDLNSRILKLENQLYEE